MATRKSRNDDPTARNDSDRTDELKKILDDAENYTTQAILSDVSDGDGELKPVIPKIKVPDIQDPAKAHELYYKWINPLKRKYLSGKPFKIIRDEINLFLKEGREKGRDGRQAYLSRLKEAAEVLTQWVNEDGKPFELYVRFQELNKRHKTS